ncbi:F0F1 ATP synthase subunit B [Hazenella sp. IB182357]|uniref:ATP synthase subunit b n=1 Tax=Polycladospora coralii TaxID=2771432 RepID=A0A926NAN0_9BACL|nr:F0F1 ATP synthase subunit B [Polycladospora coralii]MBD1372130.1 F0F1 ATP synthase subunit B [Polycladospora coralii]MBS7530636.1 F0F1 ATP synthase subunit B [Polycladospora coralii]
MLEFHFGTMITQLLIFIILLLLVSKFAMKPMLETMKKRQDHIDHQIQSAEKSNEEASQLIEQQKALLTQARQEAKDILERAKAQKDREATEIIHAAEERANRLINEATSQIEREKEKAIADLRNEVGEIAVTLTSKILQEKLDSQSQTKFVNQYLEQVGRLQ